MKHEWDSMLNIVTVYILLLVCTVCDMSNSYTCIANSEIMSMC